MISDGFSVWSFILSRLASSSITKKVPEPYLRHFPLLTHKSPFWRSYGIFDIVIPAKKSFIFNFLFKYTR